MPRLPPARVFDALKPPSPVPVVCAIIRDALGQVLLAQRPAHKHLGGKWEFPGGKVETGETPERALQREIKEELGCDLSDLRPLRRFTHDYGTVLIEMIPFTCALATESSAPQAHEHSALAWVPVDRLTSYHLAPADVPILAELTALGAG